jgi:hypothetical protein
LLCVASLALLLPSLTGCTSAPEPKAEETDEIEFTPKRRAPERPEYHAESDAVLLKTPESRALVEASCAATDTPNACRAQADRRLRGYRGSFSAPGADEVLVGVGPSAVLLAERAGKWTVVARAPNVDLDHCLLGEPAANDAPNDLVCRAATLDDWGHSLEFFRLAASTQTDESNLTVTPLDTPHATDVDTALFAGWKHEGELIEVRFHKETEVKGASQVDFGNTQTCRYRTFSYERAPEPKLAELDACKSGGSDTATDEDARSNYATYDSRLQQPISNRNRAFAMCYQRELDRIAALAEAQTEVADAKAKAANEGDAPQDPQDSQDSQDQQLTAGQIQVRFVIGSSGAPVSCEVANTTLDNPNVEHCLCREIMNTEFPPVPAGKFVDVTYPFSFAP